MFSKKQKIFSLDSDRPSDDLLEGGTGANCTAESETAGGWSSALISSRTFLGMTSFESELRILAASAIAFIRPDSSDPVSLVICFPCDLSQPASVEATSAAVRFAITKGMVLVLPMIARSVGSKPKSCCESDTCFYSFKRSIAASNRWPR